MVEMLRRKLLQLNSRSTFSWQDNYWYNSQQLSSARRHVQSGTLAAFATGNRELSDVKKTAASIRCITTFVSFIELGG